jgi:hypothetical protein
LPGLLRDLEACRAAADPEGAAALQLVHNALQLVSGPLRAEAEAGRAPWRVYDLLFHSLSEAAQTAPATAITQMRDTHQWLRWRWAAATPRSGLPALVLWERPQLLQAGGAAQAQLRGHGNQACSPLFAFVQP